MRKILWVGIFMAAPLIAHAQDVATEHTQILNNMELITENLRQLQSVENQIEMIKNQVEQLKSVASYQNNFADIDTLRGNLTSLTSQGAALSNQTQAILNQTQQQLDTWTAGTPMTVQDESFIHATQTIIENALSRVAQLRSSYQQQNDSVNALIAKNDNAVGQTQALQTSNELAAQSLAQNQSTQELLSEQISMQAAMMNKQLQEQKDEDDKMKQIFNAQDDGSGIIGEENPNP